MEEKRYYASDFENLPMTKMLLSRYYKDGVTLSELGNTNLSLNKLDAKSLNNYWLARTISKAEETRLASLTETEEE